MQVADATGGGGGHPSPHKVVNFARQGSRSGKACYALGVIFTLNVIVCMGALYWPLFFMGWFGYGDYIYLKLASYEHFFYGFAIFSTSLVVLLAVLDVGYWRGIWWYLGEALIAAALTGYMLMALTFTSTFPVASIAVYLIFCPLVLMVLYKSMLATRLPLHEFMFWIGVGLFWVSTMSFTAWIIYVVDGHYWDTKNRLDYMVRLNCAAYVDFFAIPEATWSAALDQIDRSGSCDEAFLFWISPLMLSVFCFFLGMCMMFIWRAQLKFLAGKSLVDGKVQMFVLFLFFAMLGLWVSAGISGAEIGLASVVFTFAFLFLVVGMSALVMVIGVEELREAIGRTPVVVKFMETTQSDWVRSLLLVGLAPLSLVVFPLSYLRQTARKCLFFTKRMDANEAQLVFTLEVTKILVYMRHWHWGSVMTKMVWWGVIFFSISVIISRVMNVFFSWLNEQFIANGFGIIVVVIIFSVAAFLAFQFPPMPGMPIFYAAGVIITQVCVANGWTVWEGFLLATLVSHLLKYSSMISGQLIGQIWGKRSVYIRALVSVNATEIKGIKWILLQRGITLSKVGILMGGPDWPVAVVAGILRTSYVQNCIGLIPFVLLILPTTLSGALIVEAEQNLKFATGAALALSVSVVIQGMSMVFALHFIGTVAETHKEELRSWPEDEQVKEYDAKKRLYLRLRRNAGEWAVMPTWMRLILISGVLTSLASIYVFLLFGSRCFVHFSVSDKIATTLNGHTYNLVKPLGWVGIGLVCYASVVLIIIGRWISFKVKSQPPVDDEQQLAQIADQGEDDDLASLYTDRYHRFFGACV